MFKDMKVREGTLDSFVVNEVKGYIPLGMREGDIVLDIGANIGAFTRLAASFNVDRVIAVEPDPENAAMWHANRQLIGTATKVTFLEAAVVSAETSKKTPKLNLFKNVGKNKGMHSILEHRGRDTVEVRTTPWEDLLALNPTVVKVDIEGGEFGLDWKNLPASVRTIAIELHLTKKGAREKATAIVEEIMAQGFEAVVAKEDTSGKRWTSFYIFNRATDER